MRRIKPQELSEEMQSGDAFVLDLRSEQAYRQATERIPDDVRYVPDTVERWYAELPKDRHIVTYCT
jgi:rhodanese-related sulfurtransferase